MIALGSNSYPEYLKECIDAPILLYVRGELPPPNCFGLGIVGTRTPSEYGRITTSQIVESCMGADLCIVSGLALGVDQCAHQKSLQMKIPTIGVLAHGFQNMYPSENRKLAHEIIDHGGALVSEYAPSINIEKYHFAARNRIIAGWCKVIVVVESGEKGGSLRTAHFAVQYDREVLAVPGRWVDHKSSGVNQLILNHQAEILIHPSAIKTYIPLSKQMSHITSQVQEQYSEQE